MRSGAETSSKKSNVSTDGEQQHGCGVLAYVLSVFDKPVIRERRAASNSANPWYFTATLLASVDGAAKPTCLSSDALSKIFGIHPVTLARAARLRSKEPEEAQALQHILHRALSSALSEKTVRLLPERWATTRSIYRVDVSSIKHCPIFRTVDEILRAPCATPKRPDARKRSPWLSPATPRGKVAKRSPGSSNRRPLSVFPCGTPLDSGTASQDTFTPERSTPPVLSQDTPRSAAIADALEALREDDVQKEVFSPTWRK